LLQLHVSLEPSFTSDTYATISAASPSANPLGKESDASNLVNVIALLICEESGTSQRFFFLFSIRASDRTAEPSNPHVSNMGWE
jgi:hypothetical protein